MYEKYIIGIENKLQIPINILYFLPKLFIKISIENELNVLDY